MNPLLLMLAQTSPDQPHWQHVRSIWYWNGKLYSVWPVLLGFAVLLILIAVLYVRRLHQLRQLQSLPLATFVQIATALNIALTDQWLLLRIARHDALSTPLTLLLSPTTLRHHAQHYLSSIAVWRRTRASRRLGAIEQMVFG